MTADGERAVGRERERLRHVVFGAAEGCGPLDAAVGVRKLRDPATVFEVPTARRRDALALDRDRVDHATHQDAALVVKPLELAGVAREPGDHATLRAERLAGEGAG